MILRFDGSRSAEQLSKDQLIELVLSLRQRVADLEARIAELSRPPKTPDNSSTPPSQGRKPTASSRSYPRPSPERPCPSGWPRIAPISSSSLPTARCPAPTTSPSETSGHPSCSARSPTGSGQTGGPRPMPPSAPSSAPPKPTAGRASATSAERSPHNHSSPHPAYRSEQLRKFTERQSFHECLLGIKKRKIIQIMSI